VTPAAASIPSLPLNDGHVIPQIGLGTSPLNDAQVAEAIVDAAELGYRLIDSATRYGNERGVGEGIRRTGIPREEFFVTTKLDGPFQGEDRAVAGLGAALERMDFSYVDLLLIHWPKPWEDQYVSTWRTFEQLKAEGLVRSIGVSNFKPEHLERLAAEGLTVPAVNQIQLSPAVVRADQRAYHDAHGIVTESWSPFGGGDSSLLTDPVLTAVGERYGKTPAQVMCRWHVQLGLVVIPKSSVRARMAENLDVFDFELTDADLAEIGTLAGPGGVDSDREGH
jgi:2,5-diketo-D-gluconate reductase A